MELQQVLMVEMEQLWVLMEVKVQLVSQEPPYLLMVQYFHQAHLFLLIPLLDP